jgi:molecular chaperone GrpE
MSASDTESEGPVIRDRRRIDPITGQVRQPAEPASPAQAGSAQAGSATAGQAPRGPGQPRPGKHAVSKPGSPRPDGAGQDSASQDSAGQDSAGQDSAGRDSASQDSASQDKASQDKASQDKASQDKASSEPTAADEPAGSGQAAPEQTKSPDAGATTSNQTGGADVASALAERTADLQRLQAEYANYRKRVERDRAAVREQALASVLSELLPVLDDIGRAREHDELTGGFKAVAEALEAAVTKLGLTPFGEAGEPFDPNVHEALMHSYSADVTEPACVQILQPGYRVGDRILRPARVAVAEPTDPAGARTTASTEPQASDSDQEADAGDADAGPPEPESDQTD